MFTHWGVLPACDRVTRIDMATVGAGVATRCFKGFRLEKDEAEFLAVVTKYGVEELPLKKVQMPSQHDHKGEAHGASHQWHKKRR